MSGIVSTRQLTVTTAATGTNWTAFPAQDLRSLNVTNTSGVTLLARIVGTTTSIVLLSAASRVFDTITDASQLEVKRQDDSNTQVSTFAEARASMLFRPFPARGNLVQAISIDRLFYEYTGPSIRVRRALDSAELDIGFDAFGNLDTRALLTFAAGACFVHTVYDKSGNGRNVVQTTTANQPRIVNSSGQLEQINGKPALFFDGDNDSLGNDGAGMPTGSGAFTCNVRLRFANTASSPTRTYVKWGAESLNTGLVIAREVNSDMWIRTGNGQYVSSSERNGFAKSHTLVNDSTTFRGYLDGFLLTFINLPPTYNIAAGNFTIGNNAITFASPFFGHINEVLVWNIALTDAQRVQLEENQDARHNVRPFYNLVFDGDSITTGQLGTTTYLNGWRQLLLDSLVAAGRPFKTVTVAVNGQSATTQNDLARGAGGLDRTTLPRVGQTILLAMLGKNDIGNEGNTAAQAYTDYITYVTNRKATGKYNRIVVFTTTPSFSDAASLSMTAFSNLVRQGMRTVAQGGTNELLAAGATDFVDLQLAEDAVGYRPYLDPAGWNNATYIYAPDKIHPTDAGHVLIFNQVRSTLNL